MFSKMTLDPLDPWTAVRRHGCGELRSKSYGGCATATAGCVTAAMTPDVGQRRRRRGHRSGLASCGYGNKPTAQKGMTFDRARPW